MAASLVFMDKTGCVRSTINQAVLKQVANSGLTDLGVVFIDVFVVCHFHQPVTQVVVREDKEATLQVAVNNLQVLKVGQRKEMMCLVLSCVSPARNVPKKNGCAVWRGGAAWRGSVVPKSC